MGQTVKVNRAQRLYVMPSGAGFSCWGFDVLKRRSKALAAELGMPYTAHRAGSKAAFAQHEALTAMAAQRNGASGWRSSIDLTPQLVGLEGKRVEVVDSDGARRRFTVGKSTGWIPCHLQIARANCHGGPAVMGAPFKSVRVV